MDSRGEERDLANRRLAPTTYPSPLLPKMTTIYKINKVTKSGAEVSNTIMHPDLKSAKARVRKEKEDKYIVSVSIEEVEQTDDMPVIDTYIEVMGRDVEEYTVDRRDGMRVKTTDSATCWEHAEQMASKAGLYIAENKIQDGKVLISTEIYPSWEKVKEDFSLYN